MGTSNPLRILIVDDEPELREIMKGQLEPLDFQIDGESFHFEIHEADNGISALKQIDACFFDAIVTDINMPGKGGIELLAAIRGSGRETPVIVLTSYGDKAKSVEALRLGCYAFLDKPWKADYLFRVMKGAAEQGFRMRLRHHQVESRVAAFDDISDQRRRQLRSVFRSMLTADESLHRSDVTEVPPSVPSRAPKPKAG